MIRYVLSAAFVAIVSVAASAQQALRPFRAAPELGGAGVTFVRVGAPTVLPRGDRAFALTLPTPTGEEAVCELREAPVMPAALQARFPAIRTYRGSTAEGHAVAVTTSPEGLRAYVNAPGGSWAVEPVSGDLSRVGNTEALSGTPVEPGLACGYDGGEVAELGREPPDPDVRGRAARARVEKRVYVMALACTAEYARSKGGTVASVMATFAEALNLLNAILLPETAIGFELHPDNDTLIFLDASRDPYSQPTLGSRLLGENPPAINNRIPVEEYDIGHVFTTACSDVGGVVSGRVCTTSGKARGVTCHYAGLTYIVENVMAHEVAHQFNVSHSWNNCPGNDAQRAGEAAFEPGSGSTIMSYQGSCRGNNISAVPGAPYYHVGSLQQFADFVVGGTGGSCADVVAVDNELPVIDWPYAAEGLAIPALTPFVLSATATDPDGDDLFYNWEQYDLGPATVLCNQLGESPLFRSVPPSADGNTRYFPDLPQVTRATDDCEEQLPEGGRDVTFRMTVRDRSAVGGGTVWEQVRFAVAEGTGPFAVTSQAVPETYVTGGFAPVTWDVAGSADAPINCAQVDILLSVDGGETYPIVLAEATDNDGEEGVTLPADLESDRARIQVRAVGNVFYALSASDFTIVTPTEPGFTFAPGASTRFVCGATGVEEIDFFTASLLDYDSTLTVRIASDLPEGLVASLSDTAVAPGGSTTLTVDLAGFARTDSVPVVVEAFGPDVDTVRRTVLFDVVATDFTDLALGAPAASADGVGVLPTFTYTPSAAAEAHVLQVSESPEFGIGSLEIVDPDPAGAQLAVQLATNTLYFWRVVPVNRCDQEYEGPVGIFHTFASECEAFASTAPLLIPPSVRTTVEAPIEVTATGTVNDLNVPNLRVRYTEINDVRVNLVAPDGTQQRLMSRRCGGTSTLDVGFDDEAGRAFTCDAVNSGEIIRPQNPLDTFAGAQVGGTWSLQVEVVEPSGTGGEFEAFEIEFCADVVSLPPALTVNEVEVPTGGFQFLARDFLDATDPDNDAGDLRYYLVDPPERGRVTLGDSTLAAGAYFTQAQASGSRVRYVHDGAVAERDSMTVVLTDNAGNATDPVRVPIDIGDAFATALRDAAAPARVTLAVAPNPTAGATTLRWGGPNAGGRVRVVDARGSVVWEVAIAAGLEELALDLSALPSGVYTVAYRGADGAGTRRVAVR